MTVRDIRLFGDPVLRSVCDPVDPADPRVRALAEDLIDTVQVPGRAGVAANQIGVTSRVFSWNVDGEVGVILNPVLVETRGEPELVSEGCLSVPDLGFQTPRAPWARVTGQDVDGNPIELSGEGLMAQMLQHECDHLDGKVFIMRLEGDERRAAMHAIRQASWSRSSA